MNGHYHIELESGKVFNGSLRGAKAFLARDNTAVKDAGLVCTFGCGQLHPLIEDDMRALGLHEVNLLKGPVPRHIRWERVKKRDFPARFTKRYLLKSGTCFVSGGSKLSSEYPNAILFSSRREAQSFGDQVSGFKGDIYKDYGLDTEAVVGSWPSASKPGGDKAAK